MGKIVFKWKISMIMLFMLFIMIPGLDVKAAEPDPEKSDDTEVVSKNGWEKENDKWYYYTEGKKAEVWKKIGGKWYYLSNEYGMIVGRLEDSKNRKIYLFDASGAMITKAGWKQIAKGSNSYRIDENNNCIKSYELSKDYWMYFNTNGEAYKYSWLKYKNNWYFFDFGGLMCSNTTVGINNKYYYFDKDGIMRTGWKYIDFHNTGFPWWYYFLPSGEVLERSWLKYNNNWYYMGQFGAMRGKQVESLEGKDYFFDDSGAWKQVTGWIKDRIGYWYYFDKYNHVVRGWKKINGDYYYFASDGRMVTEEWVEGYWVNKNGKWIYKPKASWHENSKGRWYGDTSGWYAKGEMIKIDGVMYTFNDEGYCEIY